MNGWIDSLHESVARMENKHTDTVRCDPFS